MKKFIILLFVFLSTTLYAKETKDCELFNGIKNIFINPDKSESLLINCVRSKNSYMQNKINLLSRIYLSYFYYFYPEKIKNKKFNKLVKNLVIDIKKYNKDVEKYYNKNIVGIPDYLVNSDKIDFSYLLNVKNYSKNEILYLIKYVTPYVTTDMIEHMPEIYDYIGVKYENIENQEVLRVLYINPYKSILSLKNLDIFLENDDFKEITKKLSLKFNLKNKSISMDRFYDIMSISPKNIEEFYLNDKNICTEKKEFCIKDFLVIIKNNKELYKLYIDALKDIENYYKKINLNEIEKYANVTLKNLIWSKLYKE